MRPALPLDAPNPRTYLRDAPVLERLMFRTSESPTGCWIWRGGVDKGGYGSIGMGGESGPVARVHRVSYEQFVGPIPDGMTIDHLCRVRNCVNPAHLEAVTLIENIDRAWARLHALGKCRNGLHEMTPENTIPTGKAKCRACARERSRAFKQRQKRSAA